MSVHIDELHTAVRATGIAGDSRVSDDGAGWKAAEERAAAARQRAEWLAARVAAEGFDD